MRVVVAVGCYVQADKARAEADTAVDLVIGNDQKEPSGGADRDACERYAGYQCHAEL